MDEKFIKEMCKCIYDQYGIISIPYIQRKFKCSYQAAANIVNELQHKHQKAAK